MPGLYPFLAADLGTTLEKLLDALKALPQIVFNIIKYFGEVPADRLLPSLLVGAVAGGLLTALVYLSARDYLELPSFSSRATMTGLAAFVFAYSDFSLAAALVIGVGTFLVFVYLYEQNLPGLLSASSRAVLLLQEGVAGQVWSVLRALLPALALAYCATLHVGMLTGIGIGLLVMLLIAYLYGENLRRFFSWRTFSRLANGDALTSLLSGVLIGGAVGAVSSQILMYPTKHCSFADGVSPFQHHLGVVLTAISATFLLFPVWTWIMRQHGKLAPSKEITSGNFRGFFVPFLLLVPTLIILVFFLYYPAIQVVDMSLTRTFLGRGSKFACLYNYEKLSQDPFYESSFITTFQVTLAIILFGMGTSLAIAVLANQKVRGAGIYRTWLIWPYAVSPVVAGVIFQMLFHPQVGPVNWLLDTFFDTRPQWFSDVHLAPWVVIFTAVWNSLGFNVLFYVAGLQNIPSDLLEAAAIDGANRLQRFLHITFPLLSPFTFFLLVTNVTYSFFGIFGAVRTLTQGGPWRQGSGATNVLIYKLYLDAFERQYKIGSAAAQSLILFLLVAGLTVLQFRYVERRVTYGG